MSNKIAVEFYFKDSDDITQGEIEKFFETFHKSAHFGLPKLRTDAIRAAQKANLFEDDTVRYKNGSSEEWQTLSLNDDWGKFKQSQIKALQAVGIQIMNITTDVISVEIDPN